MPGSLSKTHIPDTMLSDLYESRWEQVRHVNDLDQRSIVMVGSALAGLIIVYPDIFDLSSVFAFVLCVLAAVICFASTLSVIHNRVSFEYYISAIDQMENRMNAIYPGLFPMAGNYSAPKNFRDFLKRIFSSIRGPIITIFTFAFGEMVFIGLYTNLEFIFVPPFNFVVPVILAVLISIVILYWSLWKDYKSAENRFNAMNDVIRSTRSDVKPKD